MIIIVTIILFVFLGVALYLFDVFSKKETFSDFSEKVDKFRQKLSDSGRLEEIQSIKEKVVNKINDEDSNPLNSIKSFVRRTIEDLINSNPLLTKKLHGPVSVYKDDGSLLSTEEWNQAIDYAIKSYPESVFNDVWESMEREGSGWFAAMHFGFDKDVRNKLREGDFDWGSICLDSNWARLMEDAARKVMSKGK